MPWEERAFARPSARVGDLTAGGDLYCGVKVGRRGQGRGAFSATKLIDCRVIIVGVGRVKLIAAHTLYLANIDLVALERNGDVDADVGASLALGAGSMRFMQQLGLLDRLLSDGEKLKRSKPFTKDGKIFAEGTSANITFGPELVAFRRANCVRALLESLLKSVIENASLNQEPTFSASYQCRWLNIPRLCVAEQAFDTQSKNRFIMWIVDREKMDELAASLVDWPVTESPKAKDLYKSATAGIPNLEEGKLERWSLGRIVLAGDTCHNSTPNAGLSYTNGIQDIALLYNLLRNAVKSSLDSETSEHDLGEIFEGCQTIVQNHGVNSRIKQSRILSYVFGKDHIRGPILWMCLIRPKR
ncbi:hypothetical protein COCMIDRAFT_39977 [Bipolaris oryzae ATCC 44560]|uniref:FAD-binding domain-containing protein n=1 Tax=Bipolaris oryzae ATCC 44560 TaxID=930090 RepID=W6Z2L8_COCMI|nr:uncharacterized protein COCMIDRAFT_39977 [Bipolaris oryzae ATCC 44560]EUC41894.1 hypothetical protein COCMIDRAFT_39977 [Bipolaris oryzae ATCC 44560]